MKTTQLTIILGLILIFASCRFVKDINSYQQLEELKYDNISHIERDEFWTLFCKVKHHYDVEYLSDSLIFNKGINSAFWNRLELFCDTFKGHGFGPNCWHMNNCLGISG